MAGIPIPSIQTVTAKVQRSQSSVLANIFLEDTQVSRGVSDMIIMIILSQTTTSAVIILRGTVHGEIGKKSFKNNFK